MSNVILDTSALMALLQREPGQDIVRPLIKYAVMSTINVAEALTALQRTQVYPDYSLPLIISIIGTITPFTLQHAQQTAELQPLVKHKGLSLGDRACLALGIIMQCPVYTADKIWAEIKIDNLEVKLIR